MVKRSRSRRTAEQLAAGQRDISVSEFFEKNRHLLGFDNPLKALMTTVKEGVDNALDACEEFGVLPDVSVMITRARDVESFDDRPSTSMDGFTGEEIAVDPIAEAHGKSKSSAGKNGRPKTAPSDGVLFADVEDDPAAEGATADSSVQRTLFGQDPSASRDTDEEEPEPPKSRAAASGGKRGRGIAAPAEAFVVVIEDNGPGIVAAQVSKIFGKLLYGSKFHRLRQSRGQQGIGISAAGMYGQQTTGMPVRILSRTSPKKQAHYCEVQLDVQRNQPVVKNDGDRDWDRPRGTRVEIQMKAKYQRGQRSVDTYLRATAVANPHVTLRYRDPDGTWHVYPRATKTLPEEPREVKPHPEGVELGMFLRMLSGSEFKKVGAFLQNEFCRVSRSKAEEICDLSPVNSSTWLARVEGDDAKRLHAALSQVKLINPPTDCISPIGEDLLIESLAREYPHAFLRAVTRSPSVYRGNPFQVEVALAYGKGVPADGPANVLRFANRVPLLYQQGACAITKAVLSVPWRNYGVDQSKGGPPSGPLVLVVHLASVWVPFTSESKEAVAHYDEIIKELKMAVMECGRALGRHLKSEKRKADALRKRDYIARYIPKISEALQGILEFDDAERDRTTKSLGEVLDRSRKL